MAPVSLHRRTYSLTCPALGNDAILMQQTPWAINALCKFRESLKLWKYAWHLQKAYIRNFGYQHANNPRGPR